jgi:hypothetical protein
VEEDVLLRKKSYKKKKQTRDGDGKKRNHESVQTSIPVPKMPQTTLFLAL